MNDFKIIRVLLFSNISWNCVVKNLEGKVDELRLK